MSDPSGPAESRAGTPRVAAISALGECRARLRDRSLLAGTLVVAIALPVVLSLAIGGGGAGAGYHPVLAVVVPQDDPVAAAVHSALADRKELGLSLVEVPDTASARRGIEDGTFEAAVVLPPGMDALLDGGPVPSVRAVRGSAAPIAGDVADALATSVQDRLLAVSDASEIARRSGQAAPPDLTVTEALALSGVELSLPDLEDAQRSPLSYYGPSLTILAAIFLGGASARSLADEHANGVADRWAAAPAPWWAHDLGVAGAAAAIAATVSFASWAVAAWIFRVTWGSPLGVAALLLASAAVAAGLNLAILRIAGRAGNKVDGATAALVLLIGMAGGHFVPLYQLPLALRRTALLTPSGWSLRAFSDMVLLDAGAVAALRAAAVVGVMAIALLAVSMRGSSPAVRR